jgi:hypothetical protein
MICTTKNLSSIFIITKKLISLHVLNIVFDNNHYYIKNLVNKIINMTIIHHCHLLESLLLY